MVHFYVCPVIRTQRTPHMQKLLQFTLLTVVLMLSMDFSANAQASGSANIGATIVIPTTVSKESDLEFEGVAMNTSSNVDILGRVTGANISIAGTPNYVYSITMPQTVTVKAGTYTLLVGTECCGDLGSKTLSAQGSGSISVAGSIKLGTSDMLIAANTDDEDYVPNSLPVIINHN